MVNDDKMNDGKMNDGKMNDGKMNDGKMNDGKVDEVKDLEKQVNEQLANITALPINEQIDVLNNILGTLQSHINNE